MKAFRFIVVFMISFKLYSLTPSVLSLRPHNKYFSSYYLKYWKWHNKNVFDWVKELDQSEVDFILNSIANIDRWVVVDEGIKKETLLFGARYDQVKKQSFFSLEINSRVKDLLQVRKWKKQLEKYIHLESIFVKWSTMDNTICFIVKEKIKRYDHDCYFRSTMKHKYSAIEEFALGAGNGNFVFSRSTIYSRVITISSHRDHYYYFSSSNYTKLPTYFHSIIKKNGDVARLPFDKMSEHHDGHISVYYP